jgi:precorrin-6A/cobalt-precorrin-6A reductase
MTKNIWLIGGTTESVLIAKAIASLNIPFIVTVTTEAAQLLYAFDTLTEIGCMDLNAMHSFCREKNVRAIVDASHPYAVEVSHNAIATAQAIGISYLRYERNSCKLSVKAKSSSSIINLDSWENLLAGDYLTGKRVLLTVGCKALPLFKSWQERATVFARILPQIESLKIALAAGFSSDRLIAIRPPISADLETALWQQWQISLVVTKASGKAGGEEIKRQVANNLNIPLIIIARPKVSYPQQTSCLDRVLAFCRQCTLNN